MTIHHPMPGPPGAPPMVPVHDEARRREIRGALRHPLENLTLRQRITDTYLADLSDSVNS